MELDRIREVNALRRARRAVAVVTDPAGGSAQVYTRNSRVEGDLAAALADAFRTGRSGMVQVEGRDVFLNVHLPQPRLVAIGAVHISQFLAPMAAAAGYHVEIIDPRTGFATPERFPVHKPVAEWPEDALAAAPLDAYCAVAALTHDPKIDDYALVEALKAGCFYVGALGSRKTHAARLERLAAAGAAEGDLARIRGPIGLDIGAANPAEIAVSILAQVIAAHRLPGRR
jgi:xanthine dehydrogenase accessory factor